MTFLDPFAIALAAGLTIPPLVALYFLKLRREVRRVPSTLLWKRAVEDLRVNAPFQRLRRNLLLLLQLLVLILAAIALGKPVRHMIETAESTVILLIDQSASMSVLEEGGRSRLDLAKEQARQVVDNLGDDARVMVIAFCDRAAVVSSFDSDKNALRRKIESIEPTQSTSSLGEAVALAEAYAQNLIIGGETSDTDRPPESAAPPAAVFLFSDGRIEDAGSVNPQRLDVSRMKVTRIGTRSDNVGILSMDARRGYERPELLEVVAAVQNFSPAAASLDATLYVDGRNVDLQSLTLGPAPAADADAQPPGGGDAVQLAVFQHIEFQGGGLIEVVLNVDDALSADDRAWTFLPPPRRTKVLLVTDGNLFLENVLGTLSVEPTVMRTAEYESAAADRLEAEGRSVFDVVILDRHSTARLPRGNYFFWGDVPRLDGVSVGPVIDNQVIFNWDETHPLLRYVAVETIDVSVWRTLNLPPDAVSIIDGQTSPVLAYLTRDSSQFVLSAFSLIVQDERGDPRMNTDWVASVDFVVFVQNAIEFLAANLAVQGAKGVAPGEPVTVPVPPQTDEVRVIRPDGVVDPVPTAGADSVHYARTRRVGVYRVQPGVPGGDAFAVNLFNSTESNVTPAPSVELGADALKPKLASIPAVRPFWPQLLLALLGLLILEWIIYNRRVFV